MSAVASKRRSSFGRDCVQCDNELIAPERSEYRDGRHIRHLWRCGKCDCCFEDILPAMASYMAICSEPGFRG